MGDVLGGRALTFPRRASRPSRTPFPLGLVPQNDNNARFLFPIVSSPTPSMRPGPLAKMRHQFFQTKGSSTGEQRPTGNLHILRAVFLSSDKTIAFLVHYCARRCPSYPVLQVHTYRRYDPFESDRLCFRCCCACVAKLEELLSHQIPFSMATLCSVEFKYSTSVQISLPERGKFPKRELRTAKSRKTRWFATCTATSY